MPYQFAAPLLTTQPPTRVWTPGAADEGVDARARGQSHPTRAVSDRYTSERQEHKWEREGLDLHLSPYGCVATGDEIGFIEIVLNSGEHEVYAV